MGFRWHAEYSLNDTIGHLAELGHPLGGRRPRCDWRGCAALWPRADPRPPRVVAIAHQARNRALEERN